MNFKPREVQRIWQLGSEICLREGIDNGDPVPWAKWLLGCSNPQSISRRLVALIQPPSWMVPVLEGRVYVLKWSPKTMVLEFKMSSRRYVALRPEKIALVKVAHVYVGNLFVVVLSAITALVPKFA